MGDLSNSTSAEFLRVSQFLQLLVVMIPLLTQASKEKKGVEPSNHSIVTLLSIFSFVVFDTFFLLLFNLVLFSLIELFFMLIFLEVVVKL